jgi:hypothetical protein
MGDSLRGVLAVVMVAAGIAMCVFAGYLQYASLPEEHTLGQVTKRAALALGGIALIFLGSRLLL